MDTTQLLPEFKEFIQLLRNHEVRFLIVGGYAVSYHGYPRTTADIDVWVGTDPANVRAIALVLREFGFNVSEPLEEVLEYGQFLGLGVSPLRIEILTKIDGVLFEECYPRRIDGEMDGEALPFIDVEDLKTNKRASSRFKDMEDVERLEKLTRPS